MARMDTSKSTCSAPPGAASAEGITRYAWGGASSWSPADLGISPIHESSFIFQGWPGQEGPFEICPGTPFTVGTPEEGKSVRIEAELDGIHLADYVLLPPGFLQLLRQQQSR